jgi:hypothetical protein
MNRAMKSAGTRMLSVLTHLRQNFLGLAILTAAGVILWFAGWEVIGILVTVVGGFGLFWSLVSAADTGGDVVTEAYGRSDNALRLSKDEARLVTLIRDKNLASSQESKKPSNRVGATGHAARGVGVRFWQILLQMRSPTSLHESRAYTPENF